MRWDLLQVRDHIPLEQGLRHDSTDPQREVDIVRDHIPLEQGLRLGYLSKRFVTISSETIFH